jgi:hypothetical protein
MASTSEDSMPRPTSKGTKAEWIAHAKELEAELEAAKTTCAQLEVDLEASPTVVRQLRRRIQQLTRGR